VARRRFLPAIRQALTGGTRVQGDLDARIVSGPSGYVVPGQPYPVDWSVARSVEEGYSWNPYVFRCVEFVAANERARRMVLRSEDPDTGPIIEADAQSREQRRILRVLNRRANEWEIAQVWRHRLTAQFMLSSRGVFVEAVRTRSGGIHSVYLLDPDRVLPVPGRRKKNPNDPNEKGVVVPIESFRVTTAVANGSPHYDWRPPFDPDADAESQPTGIVWLRSPHPTMFERGMSPVEAAGLSVDLDRYARLYNRRFMMEDGRPGGVLSVKGDLDPQYEEVLQQRFRGGPDVSNSRTTVIQADDMSWADTSGTPRDTQWGDTMDRTKREICVAFGLPESVVSDSSGETFDNADADYAKAWEHCMLPLFRLLDGQLDVLSPGGYDDDTFLNHDVSDVWVLGRHKRAEEDRAAADLDRGTITVDEYREICGRDPWDVPATRVLWIPAARLAVDDGQRAHDGDAQAASTAPIGNGQLGAAGMSGGGAMGGAGVPAALPPGFGLDPDADLDGAGQGTGSVPIPGAPGIAVPQLGGPASMPHPGARPAIGVGGTPGVGFGPPSQRMEAQAGRVVPGGGLTQVKSAEDEQSGGRPPRG
jgi:phage portal protein BeeE